MILVLLWVKFCLMNRFPKLFAIVWICVQAFLVLAYLVTFFIRFHSLESAYAITPNCEIAPDVS